mgnify:CR=1 FL=1|jgi:hypothetical protein|tara:strand:- start:308 stop:514 length:207 start_codon:yes stop_codon:yes gene_type:complete
MNKILITTFIFVLFLNTKAFAYLDPGTGSIILQSILGAIAAGASYCAIYWQKIKNFFNKRVKKKDKKD